MSQSGTGWRDVVASAGIGAPLPFEPPCQRCVANVCWRGDRQKGDAGEPLGELGSASGANVIKLFTAVIYCNSMVIPSSVL